jgi:2-dehydro-3-deoxyphosphooctonate aldolase (KDO 8-P synthase)
MTNATVHIGNVAIANHLPFVLFSGPCQIEGRDHALRTAEAIASHAKAAGVPLIFKASYDKANRTSAGSARGVGRDEGLRILADVRDAVGCPVMTDVHESSDCAAVAEVVDVLQIPAFLCRQTDLLIAAARTGRAIHIKKGQFLAPWDMAAVADKVRSAGGTDILLCDRGVSFGYNTLVSDMRSLLIMAETGCPVVFDATHSVQAPGGLGTSSGGDRRFAPALARAAVAVGVAAVFAEAHFDPSHAPSDGPVMLPVDWLPDFLADLRALDDVTKARGARAYP